MKFRTICLLLFLMACASLAAAPLRIFYTGDTHGVYSAKEVKPDSLWQGGYLILEEHLNRLRSQSDMPSLYLDSGDQQTGTIFASLVEDGVHGGAVLQVFNRLGLDASVYGNHEFDFSYGNTRDLARLASYPFVCTNLLDKSTGKSVSGTPWTIIERGGLRIGIFGITLELLPEKVKAENVRSVRILPPADAINLHLDEVDLKTDLIVVLSHQGFEADSLLATQLDDRVDLIIGGHDHIWAKQPPRVNGKYLLYSGSHLNWLGVADLDIVDDRVASLSNRLQPLTSTTNKFSTPLADYIQQKVLAIEEQMSRLIGYIPVDWVPNKYESTPVSRWVANSLRMEYRAIYNPDLAIINNGGIRKAIPAGPLTLGDLTEMLPFNNNVVVFSCYGRDLLIFDELNAQHAIGKPHDICECTQLDGKRVDPEAIYRVVSHDYVAGQWDKYLGFKPFDVYDTGDLILDAMIRQASLQFSVPEAEGWD